MRAIEIPQEMDKAAFAQKALAIYKKHIERLEMAERGKVVAIEVDSGEVFVGMLCLPRKLQCIWLVVGQRGAGGGAALEVL